MSSESRSEIAKRGAPLVRPSDADALSEAGRLIRAGELVAFPTETVYGLGADAKNGEAVARIFAAKGRPRFNPLIVHVPDAADAALYGDITNEGRALAEAFWPGPLTMVVRRRAGSPISDLASCGLDTIALRAPGHPVAQALLSAAGRPLAAPSANRSGCVSATNAQHVADDLGSHVAMILDGGATQHGIESTIVSLADERPSLLRPGAIPIDVIEAALGAPLTRQTDAQGAPRSPGQLQSHYAPRAALRLNAVAPMSGEALLAFGPVKQEFEARVVNLSERGDLIEAAAALFAALRALDASGAERIAVSPIPDVGLGEAINDRLRRAASPRPAD